MAMATASRTSIGRSRRRRSPSPTVWIVAALHGCGGEQVAGLLPGFGGTDFDGTQECSGVQASARLCCDGLLQHVFAVEVDGVDPDGIGKFEHGGRRDAVRFTEPLELVLHPAEGVLLPLRVQQGQRVHAALGGCAADGTDQRGGGQLRGGRDGELGFYEGLPGPGVLAVHEAAG
ncbi:hypothetical protein [Streptomyces scabiei]|uniref:hypothetical protein n=1 Tax=Streptomyces scabiei TaxID=1930 RepID=UPI0038F68311